MFQHVSRVEASATAITAGADTKMRKVMPVLTKPVSLHLQELAQAVEIDNIGDTIMLFWILQMNHSLHTSIMNRMAMAAT
jgi:hypothetical protein